MREVDFLKEKAISITTNIEENDFVKDSMMKIAVRVLDQGKKERAVLYFLKANSQIYISKTEFNSH